MVRAARPQDVPLLLELIKGLAEYERMEQEVRASEAQLSQALFGERPAATALIAEVASQVAGYALFFPTFASFAAARGVWLEDLFVCPAHRRAGVGKALLAAVAVDARSHGAEHVGWAALDWNELALGFYRSVGAQTLDRWITHRLAGEPLQRLAEHAGRDTGPAERR